MSEERLGREAIADMMVNDMVSWLRRNGKRIAICENGQIRFFWEASSHTVKVSHVNTEDIKRKA